MRRHWWFSDRQTGTPLVVDVADGAARWS